MPLDDDRPNATADPRTALHQAILSVFGDAPREPQSPAGVFRLAATEARDGRRGDDLRGWRASVRTEAEAKTAQSLNAAGTPATGLRIVE